LKFKLPLFLLFAVVAIAITATPHVLRGDYLEKIESTKNEWNMEFKSSIIPFSDQSYSLNVSGNLNGKASLSLFASRNHKQPFEQVEIGPGEISFASNSPEYWCPTLYLQYKPLTVSKGELFVHAVLR